jgi:hypothetical protein
MGGTLVRVYRSLGGKLRRAGGKFSELQEILLGATCNGYDEHFFWYIRQRISHYM